jgi:two-component system chemotaxis sensor kinase CheA
MRFTLGARIFVSFAVVALVGVATIGFLVDRNVRRTALEQTASRLSYAVTMTAQLTASGVLAPIARGDTRLREPLRELGAAAKTHLSLVAPDGSVVADSERVASDTEASAADAPEVVTAIRRGRAEAVRGEPGAQRLWVAEAIRRDGVLVGVARASVPISVVDDRVTAVRHRLAIGAFIAMFVAMASALLLALGIVRPVRGLAAAARRLGEGELDVRSAIERRDELGDLSHALDDMADNLQRMVARLDERNRELRVVLDGVDQGLLTVDVDGAISVERSACVDGWFDCPLPGRALWDLFPDLSETARHSFSIGWSQLAEDVLPVELILDQLPTRIEAGPQTFELRYLPIGGDPATLRVLVVITDVTSRVASELTEAVHRDLLRVVDRALRDKDAVVEFLREADALVALSTDEGLDRRDVQRHIHTLKGNCGLQGIQSIVALCHELEAKLALGERLPTAAERELLRDRWSELRRGLDALVGRSADALVVTHEQYVDALQAAVEGAPAKELAARLASWATTPVARSFERLGEHAYALAAKLGKEVEISADAAGAQLHVGRWGRFWGALVHAVRNAVDHGLEAPEERVARGKSRAGKLAMRARLDRTHFVVELHDDGRGIDWERVAVRLHERGLPAETADELVEGLFADGLTTTSAVTELSGRGVGMSALRAAVRELGGVVEVLASPEAGTLVRCVFPAACALVAPQWVLDRELARQAAAPRDRAKSGSRWRALPAHSSLPRARVSENFFSSAGERRR